MLYINHFVVQGSVDRVLLDQKGERMLQMYKKDVRYYKKAGRVEENITLPEILPQAGLPAGIRRRDHIIAEGFIRAFGQRDYLSDRYLVSQVLIGQKYTFDTPVISRVSGIEGIGRSFDDASAYAVVAGELIGVSSRSPENPWKTLLIRTETDISQEGEKKVMQRNVIRCTYYDNAPYRPRISKFPVGSNIIVQLSLQTPVKDTDSGKRKYLDFYVEDIAIVPGSEAEEGLEKEEDEGTGEAPADAGEEEMQSHEDPVPGSEEGPAQEQVRSDI